MPSGMYKHKGRKQLEGAKKKISIARIKRKEKFGFLNNLVARDKISKSKKGKPSHRKGKKLSSIHKINLSLSHKGNKNINRKGGVTPITGLVRKSIKYQEWRKQVFTRDNFTCRECKKQGVYLEAHHDKRLFSKLMQEAIFYFPLLNIYDACMLYTPFWDINNGKTLCEECHSKTKNRRISE